MDEKDWNILSGKTVCGDEWLFLGADTLWRKKFSISQEKVLPLDAAEELLLVSYNKSFAPNSSALEWSTSVVGKISYGFLRKNNISDGGRGTLVSNTFCPRIMRFCLERFPGESSLFAWSKELGSQSFVKQIQVKIRNRFRRLYLGYSRRPKRKDVKFKVWPKYVINRACQSSHHHTMLERYIEDNHHRWQASAIFREGFRRTPSHHSKMKRQFQEI